MTRCFSSPNSFVISLDDCLNFVLAARHEGHACGNSDLLYGPDIFIWNILSSLMAYVFGLSENSLARSYFRM